MGFFGSVPSWIYRLGFCEDIPLLGHRCTILQRSVMRALPLRCIRVAGLAARFGVLVTPSRGPPLPALSRLRGSVPFGVVIPWAGTVSISDGKDNPISSDAQGKLSPTYPPPATQPCFSRTTQFGKRS